MEIAYAAYTESATFMLDATGIVLWVAPSPSVQGTGEMWRGREAADRCVGAQYVASIDMEAAGGLVELPKIGSPLIFAAVDEAGRVSLLRSGPLLKFEAKTRRTSGVHSRPTARTPIAETGNPYEDEVATVKYHPRDLMYAATPLPKRSERPSASPTRASARGSAREFFPVRSSSEADSPNGPKTVRMDPARMNQAIQDRVTPRLPTPPTPVALDPFKMPTRRVPPPLPERARITTYSRSYLA